MCTHTACPYAPHIVLFPVEVSYSPGEAGMTELTLRVWPIPISALSPCQRSDVKTQTRAPEAASATLKNKIAIKHSTAQRLILFQLPPVPNKKKSLHSSRRPNRPDSASSRALPVTEQPLHTLGHCGPAWMVGWLRPLAFPGQLIRPGILQRLVQPGSPIKRSR